MKKVKYTGTADYARVEDRLIPRNETVEIPNHLAEQIEGYPNITIEEEEEDNSPDEDEEV